MRLIDADELKKALKSNCIPELCHDYGTNWCEACCRTNDFEDLIDNAPTINFAVPINMKNLTAEEKETLIKGFTRNGLTTFELYEKRPQGEWLTHRVAFYLTCPFCGCNLRALKNEVFLDTDDDYNFCPNCGADMRGNNNG